MCLGLLASEKLGNVRRLSLVISRIRPVKISFYGVVKSCCESQMAQWDIWNVIFFLTRTTYKVFWCRVLMLSLCAADSSTLFLCVWACKRLSLTASSVFEQSCACRGADHKVLRSHMPFPGLCLTSRKWQAKHNCTLCKQCMPKLYSILPTFYLQYQLCSPRISRERMRGQIKYILSWTAGANGLCHCTLCVWFLPAAKGYDTHTHYCCLIFPYTVCKVRHQEDPPF